ncbi:MAG: cysteine desulfurase family protein [Faecousia sp.]
MIAYFDNSATTKPCAEAVAAMTDALQEGWGNPSSLHKLGIAAARQLRQARLAAAALLGCEAERVFFTSGGTEADNWAVFSGVKRLHKRGRHIITTAVEHHAVLNPVRELEAQGFEVTYLQPDKDGRIGVEALEQALRPDTIFVSVMMVNNETGAVMPIEKMARLTHRVCPDALFHTDAVQGFTKVPFRASSLGADLISVSGHKIHGPKGVGALYIRKGLSLPPYLYGGGQEGSYRSGTEALPAIAGFGAACQAAAANLRQDIAREARLKTLCREGLSQIDGLVFLGASEAPHILCVSVPGLRSQGLINCLQDEEVYVSAGSACAKGHRSHVLQAMGVDSRVIDGAVRISLSRFTTEEEVARLVRAMDGAVQRLSRC